MSLEKKEFKFSFETGYEHCKFPTKAYNDAAGWDIYSPKHYTFAIKNLIGDYIHVNIDTKLKIQLPEGYHAHVRSKSGNYFKKGIRVFNGTIDSDYRGNVIIGLEIPRNLWVKNIRDSLVVYEFGIEKNKSIAQLVILKHETVLFEQVSVSELTDTTRGEKGFGSSSEKQNE